jgi:Flp pilus assembly protein TadG
MRALKSAVVFRRMRKSRRGAAVLEFAIVAPIFFLVIIGMVELGRAVMVQQVLTNAAREGARRAILEQTSKSEVELAVNDYLAGGSISGATIAVSPAALNKIGFGDPVTVKVSLPFDQVSWLPAPWFAGGKILSATSVMRAERLE